MSYPRHDHFSQGTGNFRTPNNSRDFLSANTVGIDFRSTSPLGQNGNGYGKSELSNDLMRSRSRNYNNEDIDSAVAECSVRSSSSGDSVRHRENPVTMPWFHANISRDATERLLVGRSDGTFLVRESTNFPGDFTLSVAYRGKVEHYRIYQSGGHLTCDNEEFFSNLTQLVSHYKRDADGLCHRLVTPVIYEGFRVVSANIEDKTTAFIKENLVIPSGEIRQGDIIGHGEFGDVLLGVYKSKKVAMKVSKRHGSGMADSLLDEARFLIGLSHPNLVALVGVVLDDANIYMVTEYMANGNLVDLLRSRGRHQLEKMQLVHFAIDICAGMCYLESKRIVHRDLAARNVLLDDNMTAKISDFGLAKRLNFPGPESSAGKFPIKWTAPEALRSSAFSSKSDMWSFGVLLWEIFSFGRVPYPRIGMDGRSPIQDVVRHIERGYRMEAPEGCPTEIVRIMNDAWALNPDDRPTFSEILPRLSSHQMTN